MERLGNDWDEILKEEFEKEYYKELMDFLAEDEKEYEIFPPKEDVFTALKLTSYKDTRVLILGQDPYHGDNQAHGLAFSVREGIKTPPSLLNMYKELREELGCYIPDNGCLDKWARQGVLLLNTAFTVRAHEANSHKGRGWEIFSDNIIKKLNERDEPVIFVLWGANARKKKKLIDQEKHFVLESAHPSPLSAYRGFFGCNHFKKINEILLENKGSEIDWQIENKK